MKILGFNFTKINVEKFKDKVEGLKINTGIDVSEIAEAKAGLLKIKDTILAIKFNYSINYDPEMAKIGLEGNIVLSVDSKKAKEIISQWKDKKMPEDFRGALFNLIMRKSTLRALQFEEEMNLPAHIQLPVLKIQEKK